VRGCDGDALEGNALMPLTRSWITAGKAIFTIANPAGDHYTYRVLQHEANSYYPETYFVGLLTGPSNEKDYTYLGILRPGTGAVVLTAKSGYTADMVPVRSCAGRWRASGRVCRCRRDIAFIMRGGADVVAGC
jgi:hypothetical protein